MIDTEQFLQFVQLSLDDDDGLSEGAYNTLLCILSSLPNIRNVVEDKVDRVGDRVFFPCGQAPNLVELYKRGS
jgi:hypothetical protein